jgi:hypothetical protein
MAGIHDQAAAIGDEQRRGIIACHKMRAQADIEQFHGL